MIIDVHSHLIPEGLIKKLEFGISVEKKISHYFKIHAWGITVDAIQENMFDPSAQIEEMGAKGIDQKVISLPPFLFGYAKEAAWAYEWTRAGNDAIAKICASNPDRFLGFGIVPMQEPSSAIEEMKRCLSKLGFSGIEMGTHVNGQELDGDEFLGFFEEANRLKASVLIHPGNVLFGGRLSKYYLQNLVGNPLETTICASRLLLGGFFDRYPQIQMCFSHGGGALPFLLGRIRHGGIVRPEIKLPEGKLRIPPGMYFDSITHDAPTLRYIISQCGLNALLLGSDYPFDMGSSDPVSFIRQTVSPEEQFAIFEENPIRFLNLQV
jgi:aminocarboxymuconate-semialdehyde decarboxylase